MNLGPATVSRLLAIGMLCIAVQGLRVAPSPLCHPRSSVHRAAARMMDVRLRGS